MLYYYHWWLCSLTLKNQSQFASGCGWNVVLCKFLTEVRGRDDATATMPAQPFGHCFIRISSKLADVLRLDTVRRSNTRSDDMWIYRTFKCNARTHACKNQTSYHFDSALVTITRKPLIVDIVGVHVKHETNGPSGTITRRRQITPSAGSLLCGVRGKRAKQTANNDGALQAAR